MWRGRTTRTAKNDLAANNGQLNYKKSLKSYESNQYQILNQLRDKIKKFLNILESMVWNPTPFFKD